MMRLTTICLLGLSSLAPTADAANRQVKLAWLRNAGGKFSGPVAGAQAGRNISPAGDLNGDGRDDFVISGWNTGFLDPAGRAYIVYGTTYGLPESASLAAADVTLIGAQDADAAGQGLAAVGDVNGDSYDDLLVGAPRHDPPGGAIDSGRTYLIYGGPSLPATISLDALNGVDGVIFEGAGPGHLAGSAVAGGVDVNDDGTPDLLIGAPGASPLGRALAGQVHVIFGRDDFAATEDLAVSTDVLIVGAGNGHQAGTTVAGAGDVDGDDVDDLLIGAPFSNVNGVNSGAVSLVFGSSGLAGTVDTAALGAGGRTITGPSGLQLGTATAGGSDVDGDGFDDILLGGKEADPPAGADAGRAWLIYGSDTLAATIDVDTLGASGVTINGAGANDDLGIAVSLGGDHNGDGRPDLLIGAQNGDGGGNNSGESYLIYGGPALPTTINLSDLSFRGEQIDGEMANDRSGGAVAFLGDVDGDGLSDIGLGARLADPAGADSGSAHVVASACHRLLAEGSTAEGDSFTMKAFGPPSAFWLLFIAAETFDRPLQTNKGPFWVKNAIEIGVLPFDADGQLAFPVTVPTGLDLSGVTGYWQFLAQPQGDGCDLSQLLATPVP